MSYRAFSLVELSIVLVILGLLTGGILAGQSLIRASELRAVTTEYQRYVTAAQTFRDKYFAIPGDFRDATRFWSRQVNAAHCVTNSSATVATPGTCDGNGDGMLTAGSAAESSDFFQFWKQLALAGLIEGSYSGLAGASHSTHTVLGTNVPASKLTPAGWYASYTASPFTGNATFFAADLYHHFRFGTVETGQNTFGLTLKPEEAWNIDSKMDDGRAGTGRVMAGRWDDCTDAADGTLASARTASYLLSNNAILCSLIFANAF